MTGQFIFKKIQQYRKCLRHNVSSTKYEIKLIRFEFNASLRLGNSEFY